MLYRIEHLYDEPKVFEVKFGPCWNCSRSNKECGQSGLTLYHHKEEESWSTTRSDKGTPISEFSPEGPDHAKLPNFALWERIDTAQRIIAENQGFSRQDIKTLSQYGELQVTGEEVGLPTLHCTNFRPTTSSSSVTKPHQTWYLTAAASCSPLPKRSHPALCFVA